MKIQKLLENLNMNDSDSVLNTIETLNNILEKHDFKEVIKNEKDFKEIIYFLMRNSKDSLIESFIQKLVFSENLYLKEIIFNCPYVYPIPKIVQKKWFRDAIVEFTNSEYFKKKYKQDKQRRSKTGDDYYILRSFLTQYHNSFDYREFDDDLKNDLSEYKISKNVKKLRLDSIRLLEDDEMKIDLCYLYFTQYLHLLYKTRFMKLVQREFPDLEFPWYENYLKHINR